MARGRDIKPGFFENEELATVSRDHRLLFIALWTIADREGRLEDRPARIKIHSFPYDQDITPEVIDRMLSELEAAPGTPIRRYISAGVRCIVISNFKKHQHIHPNEKPSDLPELTDVPVIPGNSQTGTLLSALPSEPSSLLSLPPVIDHPRPRKRAAPAVGSEAFEHFWSSFPAHRRVNKPMAIKAWPGDEHADEIIAHVEAVKRKDGGEFIKQADRYLRMEMWKVPVFEKPQSSRHGHSRAEDSDFGGVTGKVDL